MRSRQQQQQEQEQQAVCRGAKFATSTLLTRDDWEVSCSLSLRPL